VDIDLASYCPVLVARGWRGRLNAGIRQRPESLYLLTGTGQVTPDEEGLAALLEF